MEIEYINEHWIPGVTGKVFVYLSFVSALLSAVSYFFSTTSPVDERNGWKKIARTSFILHGASVIGITCTLFYMLYNHLFEYSYVWQHSNSSMPLRYIFSCFWEGQEGSFLLWSIWHVILGGILLFTSKNWEAPVMTTVSLVQVFLASMLLGIFLGDVKIGSNPFILLRENPEYANIPLFQNPDYASRLDGRGLNPLLQNYWMTIHPPTLFLGFALLLVPFAYAVSGLWKKQLTEWQKPALPWAFAGIGILGLGILMGGAWAYEALSFGGFWAWDPVENASLVPWLILVGGTHIMIISKNKRGSVFSAFFFILLSFLLILYSTFLTRSGVLGESSVHAFTDLGMMRQLLLYLLFFVALSVALLIFDRKMRVIYCILAAAAFLMIFLSPYHSYSLVAFAVLSLAILLYSYWKFFPKEKEEEALWSREFWMFIGALLFMVSSFHITYYTSLPVINKIFGLKIAVPSDAIGFYNAWQLPFALLLAFLIGVGQFFKYRNSDIREVLKKLSIPFIASAIISAIFAWALSILHPLHILLLFASTFSVLANGTYFIQILKGKIKNAGASIAHTGFGLLLMGVLISTGKKQTISVNSNKYSVTSLDEKFSDQKSILLIRGDTLPMGEYLVTYKGRKKEGINLLYEIEYLKNTSPGVFKKQFTLFPRLQLNERMGNVAEPDTKHFLDKDIYTHVSYDNGDIEDKPAQSSGEYLPPKKHEIKKGDTLHASNALIILDSVIMKIDRQRYKLPESTLAVGAKLRVLDGNGNSYSSMPLFTLLRGTHPEPIEDSLPELGLRFSFWKINPEKNMYEIMIAEKRSNKKEFIVMDAHVFPMINILWAGCLMMVTGCAVAVVSRIRKT